ncbi:MAG: hypothetical protein CMH63_00640 [Nanoarchaeota archaeon]|nr:hypothetical protein [Nanoarchaeota archaeon]|tara:strand:+ start:1631 stop:2152 length:522 start_codon:yes stop_codon:yes gene_type:complete
MDYYSTLILRILTPFILSYNILNKFFFPLTLNFSYYIYRLIDSQVFLIDTYLITFNNSILFTPACAAISAYFLLLLLTVLTKDIKFLIRIKIFLLASLALFIINLLRILILIGILEKYGLNTFQQTHNIFWILFGSILVALIWILLTKYYKIKSTPIYSDLKYLLKQINAFKH